MSFPGRGDSVEDKAAQIDYAAREISLPLETLNGIRLFLKNHPEELAEVTGRTGGQKHYSELAANALDVLEDLDVRLRQMRTRLEEMRDRIKHA
jgi:hypothetical protein